MHKPLTAIDRCDRCGAQAYAVTEHSGRHLYWCVHHLDEHPEVLQFIVLDETALIRPKEPAGA